MTSFLKCTIQPHSFTTGINQTFIMTVSNLDSNKGLVHLGRSGFLMIYISIHIHNDHFLRPSDWLNIIYAKFCIICCCKIMWPCEKTLLPYRAPCRANRHNRSAEKNFAASIHSIILCQLPIHQMNDNVSLIWIWFGNNLSEEIEVNIITKTSLR